MNRSISSVISMALFSVILIKPSSIQAAHHKKSEGHTFIAIKDFKSIDQGEVPYYIDKARKALAINAAKVSYRDKWAKASMRFNLPDGTYKVTLTTLTEEDGECTYKVYVGQNRIGEYQNPEVDKKKDSKPHQHSWQNITIKKGDVITVQSNSHSNGKIPENDAFAWARGRWRQITFNKTQ